MALTQQAGGLGSIAFGQPVWGPMARSWGPWGGAPVVPTFESIPEAKAVYDQIRAAREAGRSSASA
jgi:hypothetical protein